MIAIYEHGRIVEFHRTLEKAEATGCTFFRCGGAGAVWQIVHRERRDEEDVAVLHVTLSPVDAHRVPLTHPVLELPLPQRVGP